jgi:hypothetical protein
MKKSYIQNSAILAALAAVAPQALAGGYQVLEKNARGLGRAYAGESAAGDDASAVGSNPAAMSRLKRPQFTVSASSHPFPRRFPYQCRSRLSPHTRSLCGLSLESGLCGGHRCILELRERDGI